MIHVLVVDDSAVVRETIAAILRHERIHVAVARDPVVAKQRIAESRPDVIILDLDMPRMDGLTFLRTIVASDPTPVIICSALTGEGTRAGLDALEEGAAAVITKPRLDVRGFLSDSAVMLVDAVRNAARSGMRRRVRSAALPAPVSAAPRTRPETIVAIGASTGGTEALRGILGAMPVDCPGIVVVQHMPEHFTRAFAKRLDAECAIAVKEAVHGDAVVRGRALIAPGNRHMLVHRGAPQYFVELADGELVSRHRPSVDVLFMSVARAAGANATGVLLTGMGEDGAEGMCDLRRAGAHTIAQDEASCVVFGMPREAILRGGAAEIVPLEQVAAHILRAAAQRPLATPA
jgi:two-component system, chemotaxis family, protein-glutamate methylesterase/glutaminase